MSKIICILGYSGSGKDCIKRFLAYPFVVSYRTRPIRQGEVEGEDGYFVTLADYKMARNKGNIVAETVYNGHHYWTTREQFTQYLNNDIPVIYVVDGNGVKLLKSAFGEDKIYSIWLDVSSEELVKRMIARGDSAEKINSRLEFHQQVAKDKGICQLIVNANRTINEIGEDILKTLKEEQIIMEDRKIEAITLNGMNFHGHEALKKCVGGVIEDGRKVTLVNIDLRIQGELVKEYGDGISFIR